MQPHRFVSRDLYRQPQCLRQPHYAQDRRLCASVSLLGESLPPLTRSKP